MLAPIFDAFIQESPISVMMRGLMERIFRAERMDELFEHHAQVQYTRELLFSSVVNLLSLVVCGIHPSVNAAYKAKAQTLNVQRAAVYQKLNGVELAVMTNLLHSVADAVGVSKLYRERWQVEGLFLTVTTNFEAEIETFAYPKAALFSFALALVTYNILATLKAALASVHGVEKVEAALSDFYGVDEVQSVDRGMMIAVPLEHWQCFHTISLSELAGLLQQLAAQVNLKWFLKQPRKSKSKTPPRVRDPQVWNTTDKNKV